MSSSVHSTCFPPEVLFRVADVLCIAVAEFILASRRCGSIYIESSQETHDEIRFNLSEVLMQIVFKIKLVLLFTLLCLN